MPGISIQKIRLLAIVIEVDWKLNGNGIGKFQKQFIVMGGISWL